MRARARRDEPGRVRRRSRRTSSRACARSASAGRATAATSRRPTTRSPASRPRSKATSTIIAAGISGSRIQVRRRQGRRRQDDLRRGHGASRAARAGHRTLVVSTDPAPSLGDALASAARRVSSPRQAASAGSTRSRSTRRARARALARRAAASCSRRSRCAARGSTSDDVARLLRLSLPGIDEIAALLELADFSARRPLRLHRRRHGADRPHAAHAGDAGAARRHGQGLRSHAGQAPHHGRTRFAAAGRPTPPTC